MERVCHYRNHTLYCSQAFCTVIASFSCSPFVDFCAMLAVDSANFGNDQTFWLYEINKISLLKSTVCPQRW